MNLLANGAESLWIGPFMQFCFTIVPLIIGGIILIVAFEWFMRKNESRDPKKQGFDVLPPNQDAATRNAGSETPD
jgi:hypothetical protein